ncbi:protein PTST homolog 2, chloroplastic-like isoform X1 [Cucurbita maxima]|uniref:Protein PTST homolog 2, chloroplastic-like isoform X1 n=1 Tax=Cucurbita maxima TaxID=3661 RepID=A0A6J1KAY9_CUCMA|nr:protein PTST homolog 2, chloroplastic-like isoform X1 [Cucurbita maxima]
MLYFGFFTSALPASCCFPNEFGCLSPCVFPSVGLVCSSRCGGNPLHMAATETRCAFLSSKGMINGCSGFVRRCKNLDREGDFELEAEILEFMESSRNPDAFPSKKDLIEAGREDLVDAIVKKGGWLCLGWDLNDREFALATDWDSFGESNCSKWDDRQRFATAVSRIASASTPSSFTGRSLETVVKHESGIEGILSRLEKERSVTFGARKNDSHPETSGNEKTVADLQGSTTSTPLSAKRWSNLEGYLCRSSFPGRVNGLGGSVSPEVPITWNTLKTDLQDGGFEASEIALRGGRSGKVLDVLRYETPGYRQDSTNSNSGKKEMNHNQMRLHLQNMELELSNVLGSLRSNAFASEKDQSKCSDDLLELSDAFEFQENRILNAKDELRSIRAKLAVVEGKMALTIIDAQKVIEEKQKNIKCARRALQMLRTACVVWPNSASEVLLVGSFDGWSNQRKMVRSSVGVFSLFLKLSPGKYEIKFIVDGQWKIDPLRPIVISSGYENNLLIIT